MNTRYLFLLAAAACAPSLEAEQAAPSTPAYVNVDGNVPAGFDVEAVAAGLDSKSFAIVGEPGSPDVAVITRSDERAPATWNVVDAVCVDCAAIDCSGNPGGFTRDLQFILSPNTPYVGPYTVTPLPGSTNYASPTIDANGTSTAVLAANPTMTNDVIDFTGTLSTCGPFTFYFDLDGDEPEVTTCANTGECASGEVCSDDTSTCEIAPLQFEMTSPSPNDPNLRLRPPAGGFFYSNSNRAGDPAAFSSGVGAPSLDVWTIPGDAPGQYNLRTAKQAGMTSANTEVRVYRNGVDVGAATLQTENATEIKWVYFR